MNWLRIFFTVICLLLTFLSPGQDQAADWLSKAEELKDEDPKSSHEFLDLILESDSTNIDESIWRKALQLKGLAMMYNYQFDQANNFFSRAYLLLPDGENIERASLLLDIGRNYNWQSRYDTALSLMLEAKKLFELNNDTHGTAETLNAIAIIYIEYSGNIEMALTAFREAMALHQSQNDTANYARVIQNIGQLHNMVGRNDSALYFLRKSMDLAQKQKDTRSMAIGANILGAVYYDLDELDSSVFYFKEAIRLDLINQDSVGLIYDYAQLARTLEAKGDLTEAETYAIEAFTKTKDLTVKSEISETLSRIYEKMERPQRALEFHKHFKNLTDSVRNKEQRIIIADLQTKYETSEKEKRIEAAAAALESEMRFRYFLLTLIGLVIIFGTGGAVLVIQRSKLKNSLLSQEVDNLRLQINALMGLSNQSIDLKFDELNSKLNNPLSDREFEILELAIGDKNNREIAEQVYVSINTVKFHLKNIYTKLGVSNRKEALEFVSSPIKSG